MIDMHGLHPAALALLAAFALVIGFLGMRLLWEVEHPKTRFVPWVKCITGDGHLPGTREQNGGHRCIFCNDPLGFEDLARVRHDRVTLKRDPYTETTRDTWA